MENGYNRSCIRRAKILKLPAASDGESSTNTGELIRYAGEGLEGIYEKGRMYKRAGLAGTGGELGTSIVLIYNVHQNISQLYFKINLTPYL